MALPLNANPEDKVKTKARGKAAAKAKRKMREPRALAIAEEGPRHDSLMPESSQKVVPMRHRDSGILSGKRNGEAQAQTPTKRHRV